MKSNSCHEFPSIIFVFLLFFMLLTTVLSETYFKKSQHKSQTFESSIAPKKMKLIKAQLKNINKPFVKSIKSPDGDIIDCVLFHLQPAFDLPQLKGTMPLDLPEIPSGNQNTEKTSEVMQLWNSRGESCPNGTIPIRRTSARDLLRFTKFGKKMSTKSDVIHGHEHALGFVKEGEYYGGQASFNVWAPNVTKYDDFSASQIWVVTDIPNHQSNSVEAGYTVYPYLFEDYSPRLFIYWTADGYNQTGCYNLLCSGFVQINNKLSLGAALGPMSTYNGVQYVYTILIWKSPIDGHWWLRFGNTIMGYWPSNLFTDLRDKANNVHFGGEVYSRQTSHQHTSTQMGSGHFPYEGFGKASFVRNMQLIDAKTKYSPISVLSLYATQPKCYDVTKGHSTDGNWGTYIYFGGPGNNPNCQ